MAGATGVVLVELMFVLLEGEVDVSLWCGTGVSVGEGDASVAEGESKSMRLKAEMGRDSKLLAVLASWIASVGNVEER